jgi:hypothetical protein
MADSSAKPEAGRLPREQGKARFNLKTCFRKSPDIDEVFSAVGKNSKRLLQARQDERLNVTYVPEHEDPRRSQSLYNMLPRPSRKLYAQATYCWDQEKDERLHVWIVVANAPKHLLEPNTKRTLASMLPHAHRALFNVGNPNIGVRTLQFLQHMIGDLCERSKYQWTLKASNSSLFTWHLLIAITVPSHIPLGELDEGLKAFIIRTARHHAGLTSKLPLISLLQPVGDQPAAVQTSVPLMYHFSTGGAPAPCILAIQFDLQCIPQAKTTLDLPRRFERPSLPDPLPAPDIGGHDEDTQKHALSVLAWISAHITDRVFEPGSVDSYVGYLKRLVGLDPGSNASHAGKHDGKKIYAIAKAEAGYIILPGPDVISRDFSAHLPRILVADERVAVLRAAERLETTYLATGSIESAWAACARRADFETMCVQQDEYLPPARCTCLFEDRLNTVHFCNRCSKSLLCEDNATKDRRSGASIICTGCITKTSGGP